ncbi:hypothetical protein DMENIID0001_015090 [Sergentomyia squamirostris]
MSVDKIHIRHCMLFHFHQCTSAAETRRKICKVYGWEALAESSCRDWFRRFKKGDFRIEDKPRSGRPKEVEDMDLNDLLADDPNMSAVDLAKTLKVDQSTVNRRLHAMGLVVNKKGKAWVPSESVNQEDDL